MREVTLADVPALAVGAAVLGTGGGGNTYIGQVSLEKALQDHDETVKVISAADVPDDALVCAIGGMGAPTVGIEKLYRGDEFVNALRALEVHLGQRFAALVIGEIGGANALRPLITALQMGLPVVDGDAMGRAFPELQMDTFAIGGVPASPMALADTHGNAIVFHQIDAPQRAEQYARSLTIEMGGTAALAMPAMRGQVMKAHLIRGTLSLAQRLGVAVCTARQSGADVVEAIAMQSCGRVLARGKITDIYRRTTAGFARGEIEIVPFDAHSPVRVAFQNENLIAWAGDKVLCAVPDLIVLVDVDTGEPVGTEMLRYGLRVAVLGMPAPPALKTPAALEVIGPAAFGYSDVPFIPLPGGMPLP